MGAFYLNVILYYISVVFARGKTDYLQFINIKIKGCWENG